MIQSIGITSFLMDALKSDENLMQHIDGNSIYPIDAIEGTHFPFIVINRDGIESGYDKLNSVIDIAHISVTVVAKTYSQSIDIANAVREALELKVYEDENIKILRIELEAVDEALYNNAYVQQLQFQIKIT